MSFIDFESALDKEKQRQYEREAREVVLQKAKEDYEKRQTREENARKRGEHLWMLPSVEAQISKTKKKKKEKKKKKKKDKKSKKKKAKESDSSSSESDDEASVWLEKTVDTYSDVATEQAPQHDEPKKRDEWMEISSLYGSYTRDEMRERDGVSRRLTKQEEREKKEKANKLVAEKLELNPYLKSGGSEPQIQSRTTIGMDAVWLRKAMQRAKEQAEQEGKSLEEIAAQRWGGLHKFNELLAEAEGRGSRKECQQEYKRKGDNEKRSGRSYERRSKSRERGRDISKEVLHKRKHQEDNWGKRDRSRSRDKRKRNRSRDRNKRSRSRSGRRKRSKSRNWSRSRSRSSSRDRRRRSRSKDKRRSRSSSGDRKYKAYGRQRGRSKERDLKKRRSSSRSSGRSNSSSSSSSNREINWKRHHKNGSDHRSSHTSQPSTGGKCSQPVFLKPGEELPEKSLWSSQGKSERSSRDASRNWRKKTALESESSKKEILQSQKWQKPPQSPSSSSSSSESADEEVEKTKVKDFHRSKGSAQSSQQKQQQDFNYPNIKEAGNSSSPPVKYLTDKEMNSLAAKIMKAEIMGNEELASQLKVKLEAARELRNSRPPVCHQDNKHEAKEEMVVLTRTDSKGFTRPITAGEEESSGERKKKMKSHGKDGKRTKYFPDDDKYTLKAMFEKEKLTSAADQNDMFERAVLKNMEKLTDDYDIDDHFISKATAREDIEKEKERDRQKAIKEHLQRERTLESCRWCFEADMPKHLIVALGSKVFLCLPPHQSLVEGHCIIAPIHHTTCMLQVDEDVWSEMQTFRRALVQMFEKQEEDCIFFESARRLQTGPHLVLHCVPLPRDVGDMAPIYFKKAILECEAEWAQNKKLVDLKGRDIRSAVPKGLPYFYVDFGMSPGFAHVIEDERDFPNNFAQEIVGGMLDLETHLWRKPKKENFDAQRRKVMAFSKAFTEFDPTQQD